MDTIINISFDVGLRRPIDVEIRDDLAGWTYLLVRSNRNGSSDGDDTGCVDAVVCSSGGEFCTIKCIVSVCVSEMGLTDRILVSQYLVMVVSLTILVAYTLHMLF
jgi:hypothetical protein